MLLLKKSFTGFRSHTNRNPNSPPRPVRTPWPSSVLSPRTTPTTHGALPSPAFPPLEHRTYSRPGAFAPFPVPGMPAPRTLKELAPTSNEFSTQMSLFRKLSLSSQSEAATPHSPLYLVFASISFICTRNNRNYLLVIVHLSPLGGKLQDGRGIHFLIYYDSHNNKNSAH